MDESKDLEDSGIRIRSEHCRKLFETSLTARTSSDLSRDEWITDRMADFNIWATSVGAFAPKRLSTDHRLRAFPDIKNVLTDLLDLLAIDLEDGLYSKCICYLNDQAAICSLFRG